MVERDRTHSSELSVGRWMLDVRRWTRLCRRIKSPLPLPSNQFSWNEGGACANSPICSAKNCRQTSESANRGKLSIVRKRKASWLMGRYAERLCMNCGRNTDGKSSETLPTLHVFRCSSKLSMRRKNYRYRCILLKILPVDWEASQRANFGMSPPQNGTPSCCLDFVSRSRVTG